MMNKENKMIIAVDGYSSCGKSTFAKAIAQKLGYVFIDTGAMYRAVTLYALRAGIVDDAQAVVSALGDIEVRFIYNSELGRGEVYLNGENVDSAIRGMEVSGSVSKVAQIREVREKLVAMQQAIGEDGGVVMDGRDIGTVVFPKADIKLFMTASVDVRAQRRYLELSAKGDTVSLDEIRANVADRDFQDENRAESPLRKAEDAIILDNSDMTPDEQMVWFDQLLTTITSIK